MLELVLIVLAVSTGPFEVPFVRSLPDFEEEVLEDCGNEFLGEATPEFLFSLSWRSRCRTAACMPSTSSSSCKTNSVSSKMCREQYKIQDTLSQTTANFRSVVNTKPCTHMFSIKIPSACVGFMSDNELKIVYISSKLCTDKVPVNKGKL